MVRHIKTEYEQTLRELYPTSTPIEQIAEQMKLSKNTVEIYARRLGLKRPKPEPWNALSEKEERLIYDMYEFGDFDELSELVGKSKHTISEWARKRGLVRQINVRRNGDISILLNDSLQTYYWLGVLAADGYISKNGHLMFSQGEKDKDMVYQFAKYVNSTVYTYEVESGYKLDKRTVYRVNVSDNVVGPRIRKLWGMKDESVKTYSSISSGFIENENQAKAFLIGLFDGDGNLTKSNTGQLEMHSNWKPFLEELSELSEINFNPKITKRGYVQFTMNRVSMNKLKSFIETHALIHNPRKWNIE